MPSDLFERLPQLAVEDLFISFVGWLGLWLLIRSVGIAKGCTAFGGPYAFLAVWGLAVLVNFNTRGNASSAFHALYFSLLALGCFVWLIATIARTFTHSSGHHRGRGDKQGHA
jgi:hypothetical protein